MFVLSSVHGIVLFILLIESRVLSLQEGDLVASGVLSGNRNFEGRIHPLVRANYLASPPLVVSYAIAGSTLVDLDKEPIGTNDQGEQVFLKYVHPPRPLHSTTLHYTTRTSHKLGRIEGSLSIIRSNFLTR